MKTAVRAICDDVLLVNNNVFFREYEKAMKSVCDEDTIKKIRENKNILIDKLKVETLSYDNKLFVAKQVLKLEEYPDDIKVAYLLSLCRYDAEYMKSLFNKSLYRKMVNNIEYNKFNLESIMLLNDYRFYCVMVKNKKFLNTEIEKDLKDDLIDSMVNLQLTLFDVIEDNSMKEYLNGLGIKI